MGDIII